LRKINISKFEETINTRKSTINIRLIFCLLHRKLYISQEKEPISSFGGKDATKKTGYE